MDREYLRFLRNRLILVNAAMAIAFGIFYEGVKFCKDLGISPWWAASACLFVYCYAMWLSWECKQAEEDSSE